MPFSGEEQAVRSRSERAGQQHEDATCMMRKTIVAPEKPGCKLTQSG